AGSRPTASSRSRWRPPVQRSVRTRRALRRRRPLRPPLRNLAADGAGSGRGGGGVHDVSGRSSGAPHLIALKPMVLTIFFANRAKRISMGAAASRVAAISPDQAGPVPGAWARNTPSATVSTRDWSVYETISDQKYSFQAVM